MWLGRGATSSDREAGSEAPSAQRADGGAAAGGQPWQAEANDGPRPGEVIRTLTAGQDLIIVTQRDVTSIDRRTGEKNWNTGVANLDNPQGKAAFCGASTTAANGVIAVAAGWDPKAKEGGRYRPTCGLVSLLDLETGKLGATVQVAYTEGAGSVPVNGVPVEIIGDTVVAAWNSTIFGLNLADLSTRWNYQLEQGPGRKGQSCRITDMALGESDRVVVAMSTCTRQWSADVTRYVDEVDVAGRPLRNHQFSDEETRTEIASLEMVSASPLVVSVYPGVKVKGQVGSLVTLGGDSWQVQNVIHDERTKHERPNDEAFTMVSIGWDSRVGTYRVPNRTLVSDETLVSFTPPNRGKPNALVVVDLSSGKELWTSPAPAGTVYWQVLAIEDDAVVALAADTDNKARGLHVVRVDRKTGKVIDRETTEVQTPTGGRVVVQFYGFVYADKRAYGVEFQHAGEKGGDLPSWLAFSVG
ncbi:hypothetical protein [Actinopolymorpha sp. B9G3]|uniref:hypothetical protein n=1 Tax=Actinopolymorpha sp. B9G3 TaxID=3158970 RepID=UPI0032D92E29